MKLNAKTLLALTIFCAFCCFLTGCGEAGKDSNREGDLNFQISADSMEFKAIAEEARNHLAARNWDKLEELAGRYRTSREAMVDGQWKLEAVYQGLQIDYVASGEQWDSHIKSLTDYSSAKPDSITARVTVADNFVRLAWKARGGGAAQTVTQTGWRLFRERLQQASATLENSKKLTQKCPYFWNAMFDVARGLGYDKNRFERLYDEATRQYPNNATHAALMMISLLPRWNGVPGELEAFLASSADKLSGDDGDFYYAQVCWQFQTHRNIRNAFRDSQLSWERSDRGFHVMEQKVPSSDRAKNIRAFMAAMGGNPEAVRDAVIRLGGNIDLAVWESPERFQSAIATLREPNAVN